MKSNYLICRMQHYTSTETVKRYMTQIENSLTVPCWHHVWRESKRKALWVNMAALCAKDRGHKIDVYPQDQQFFDRNGPTK